jgi:hypothetical protein
MFLPSPALAPQFFEGKLVEGDLKTGGHILQATSGSGPNRQVYNYSTDRVVGNGSFGVVFQATCLETGETVSDARASAQMAPCGGRLLGANMLQVKLAMPQPKSPHPVGIRPTMASCRRWPSRRCCRTSGSKTVSCRS